MEQIIQQLVDARKNRGLSLEELHSRTKIPLSQLEALEQYNFAKIGPDVYLRGFIRRYAKEVGLDGDELLGSQVQPIQEEPNPVIKMRKRRETSMLPGLASIIGILVLIGLAGWLVFVGISALRESPPDLPPSLPDTGQDPGTDPDPDPDPDPAPGPVPDPDPVAELVAVEGRIRYYQVRNVDELEITLTITGACWVKVVVDGEQPIASATYNREEFTFTGQDVEQLILGAARNGQIVVNGIPLEVPNINGSVEYNITIAPVEGENGE